MFLHSSAQRLGLLLAGLFCTFSFYSSAQIDCEALIQNIQGRICLDDINGNISGQVSIELEPIEFSIRNLETNEVQPVSFNSNRFFSVPDLSAGIYVLTAQSGVDRDCIDRDTFQLTRARLACLVLRNDDGSQIIRITPSGGTAPYNMQLGFPDGSLTNFQLASAQDTFLTDLAPGDYNLRLLDSRECIDKCAFIIEEDNNCDDFQLTFTAQDPRCEGINDGSITVNFTENGGGTPPIIFNWNRDELDGTQSPANLGPGLYSLTATDAEGCVDSFTTRLSLENPLNLNCFVGDNGLANIAFSGGEPAYNLRWSGPEAGNRGFEGPTTFTFEELSPGTYTFTIVDAQQCEQSCELTIGCALQVGLKALIPPSCAGEASGVIELAINGAISPPQISWNTGANTRQIRDLDAGTYSVTVTDIEANCTDILEVTLVDPEILELGCQILLNEDPTQDPNSAQITFSSGRAPYVINWAGPGQTSTTTREEAGSLTLVDLPTGRYDVTLTDANECQTTCSFTLGSDEEEDFIIDSLDLFSVEFDTDISMEDFDREVQEIKDKGGVQLKTCNCQNGIPLLQLWEAGQDIILDGSGTSGSSKSKEDTSGLGKTLVLLEQPLTNDDAAICIESPGTGDRTLPTTIKVAIIDSGANIDSDILPDSQTHPVLEGIQWRNQVEVNQGLNNADEDRNCKPDDFNGYDFLEASNIVVDEVGHGTHIAGILANSYPAEIKLQLMNLKVFNKEEDPTTGEITSDGGPFELACAIHYALNNGARVINISLGYFNEEPSNALYNALKRAEAEDVLVVASSGNEGLDLNEALTNPSLNRWPLRFTRPTKKGTFPLDALTNLLIVAALDSTELAIDTSYSNTSDRLVHIAAPANFNSTYLNDGFETFKGTSMATASVSRFLSILRAKNSSIPSRELIDTIVATATPIQFGDRIRSGGKINEAAVAKAFGLEIDGFTKEDSNSPIPTEIDWGTTSFTGRVAVRIKIGGYNSTDLFDNVQFTVTDSNGYIFYSEELCIANTITWDGIGNNGTHIPAYGTFTMNVVANGVSFGPQQITFTTGY